LTDKPTGDVLASRNTKRQPTFYQPIATNAQLLLIVCPLADSRQTQKHSHEHAAWNKGRLLLVARQPPTVTSCVQKSATHCVILQHCCSLLLVGGFNCSDYRCQSQT